MNQDTLPPLLQCGATTANFSSFKEKINIACLERYKNLGRCLESGKYFEAAKVDPTKFDMANDPHGVNKARLLKAYEDFGKAERKLEEEKPSMFAFILSRVSPTSKERIMHNKDWGRANDEKYPNLCYA